ncbi:uncharacterized protein [Amphiura filiformis]|uniref:uncharacterized protein n=1 Tax=Amphiura filiformis TaxID=82378 RepID=UPI003B213C82
MNGFSSMEEWHTHGDNTGTTLDPPVNAHKMKCIKCGLLFLDTDAFAKHVLEMSCSDGENTPRGKYVCGSCGSQYNTRDEFRMHENNCGIVNSHVLQIDSNTEQGHECFQKQDGNGPELPLQLEGCDEIMPAMKEEEQRIDSNTELGYECFQEEDGKVNDNKLPLQVERSDEIIPSVKQEELTEQSIDSNTDPSYESFQEKDDMEPSDEIMPSIRELPQQSIDTKTEQTYDCFEQDGNVSGQKLPLEVERSDEIMPSMKQEELPEQSIDSNTEQNYECFEEDGNVSGQILSSVKQEELTEQSVDSNTDPSYESFQVKDDMEPSDEIMPSIRELPQQSIDTKTEQTYDCFEQDGNVSDEIMPSVKQEEHQEQSIDSNAEQNYECFEEDGNVSGQILSSVKQEELTEQSVDSNTDPSYESFQVKDDMEPSDEIIPSIRELPQQSIDTKTEQTYDCFEQDENVSDEIMPSVKQEEHQEQSIDSNAEQHIECFQVKDEMQMETSDEIMPSIKQEEHLEKSIDSNPDQGYDCFEEDGNVNVNDQKLPLQIERSDEIMLSMKQEELPEQSINSNTEPSYECFEESGNLNDHKQPLQVESDERMSSVKQELPEQSIDSNTEQGYESFQEKDGNVNAQDLPIEGIDEIMSSMKQEELPEQSIDFCTEQGYEDIEEKYGNVQESDEIMPSVKQEELPEQSIGPNTEPSYECFQVKDEMEIETSDEIMPSIKQEELPEKSIETKTEQSSFEQDGNVSGQELPLQVERSDEILPSMKQEEFTEQSIDTKTELSYECFDEKDEMKMETSDEIMPSIKQEELLDKGLDSNTERDYEYFPIRLKRPEKTHYFDSKVHGDGSGSCMARPNNEGRGAGDTFSVREDCNGDNTGEPSEPPVTTDQMKCIECGELFVDIETLAKHILKMSCYGGENASSRKYVCRVCGSQYNTRADLRRHENNHIELSLKCSFCKDFFSSSDARLRHQEQCMVLSGQRSRDDFGSRSNCDNEVSYELKVVCKKLSYCTDCHQAFTSNLDYLRHQEEMHVEKQNACKPYVCSGCGEGFSLADLCLKHASVCELLSRVVETNRELDEDVIELESPNTGDDMSNESAASLLPREMMGSIQVLCEKLCYCAKCNQTFTAKLDLANHQREHMEKQYQCRYCQRDFKQWKTFIWHQKNVCRKFRTCSCCHKEFRKVLYRLKHELTHESLSNAVRKAFEKKLMRALCPIPKAYCCGKCGKRFTKYEDCLHHKVLHHAKMKSTVVPPKRRTGHAAEVGTKNATSKPRYYRQRRIPQKMFTCSGCHKRFFRSDICTSHEMKCKFVSKGKGTEKIHLQSRDSSVEKGNGKQDGDGRKRGVEDKEIEMDSHNIIETRGIEPVDLSIRNSTTEKVSGGDDGDGKKSRVDDKEIETGGHNMVQTGRIGGDDADARKNRVDDEEIEMDGHNMIERGEFEKGIDEEVVDPIGMNSSRKRSNVSIINKITEDVLNFSKSNIYENTGDQDSHKSDKVDEDVTRKVINTGSRKGLGIGEQVQESVDNRRIDMNPARIGSNETNLRDQDILESDQDDDVVRVRLKKRTKRIRYEMEDDESDEEGDEDSKDEGVDRRIEMNSARIGSNKTNLRDQDILESDQDDDVVRVRLKKRSKRLRYEMDSDEDVHENGNDEGVDLIDNENRISDKIAEVESDDNEWVPDTLRSSAWLSETDYESSDDDSLPTTRSNTVHSYGCVCGKSFALASELAQHMLVHAYERKHRCTKCAISLKTISVAKHTAICMRVCVHCRKEFKSREECDKHEPICLVERGSIHVSVTSAPERKHKCSKCAISLKTISVAKHTAICARVCIHCRKEFKLREECDKHESICPVGLSKGVGNSSACDGSDESGKVGHNNHMIAHSDQRNFKCGKCSTAFTRKSHLTRHQVYNCKQVSKAGDTTDTAHSGQRNYKCGKCSSAFTRKSHLTRHQLYNCKRVSKAGDKSSKEEKTNKSGKVGHDIVKESAADLYADKTSSIGGKDIGNKGKQILHTSAWLSEPVSDDEDIDNKGKQIRHTSAWLSEPVSEDEDIDDKGKQILHTSAWLSEPASDDNDKDVIPSASNTLDGQVCKVCGKSFERLAGHMRVHLSKRRYKCRKCSFPFKMKGHVRRHMAICVRVCVYCGMEFESREECDNHEAICPVGLQVNRVEGDGNSSACDGNDESGKVGHGAIKESADETISVGGNDVDDKLKDDLAPDILSSSAWLSEPISDNDDKDVLLAGSNTMNSHVGLNVNIPIAVGNTSAYYSKSDESGKIDDGAVKDSAGCDESEKDVDNEVKRQEGESVSEGDKKKKEVVCDDKRMSESYSDSSDDDDYFYGSFPTPVKNYAKKKFAIINGEYVCTECNQSFTKASQLKIHLVVHSNPAYQCSNCKYRFKRKIYLQKHRRTCVNACKYCDKEFESEKERNGHEEGCSNKNVENKQYTCSFCARGFHELSRLQGVMKSLMERKSLFVKPAARPSIGKVI